MMKRIHNKALIISVVINIILTMAVVVLVLNKLGIITRSSVSDAENSYLNNPQYDANLTMFSLISGDAEVIFAGDSITAFGRFSEFFPSYKVMNRGIGSDTTEGLYNRMDELLSHHPQKVFIMIGINDIARGVSKEDSLKYYEMIISQIKGKMPNCEIYVQSILPTLSDNLDVIVERNDAISKMCKENSIEYINLYDLFLKDDMANPELLSKDGVHLNGRGYRVWIDNVKDYLNE